MKYEVKSIDEQDRVHIEEWYRKRGEPVPSRGLMPDGTTFVLFIEGVQALSVSLYPSNSEAIQVEAFIGNPSLEGELRRRGTQVLLDYISNFAKELGYQRLWCMAPNERLRDYYEKIGFVDSGYLCYVLKKEL